MPKLWPSSPVDASPNDDTRPYSLGIGSDLRTGMAARRPRPLPALEARMITAPCLGLTLTATRGSDERRSGDQQGVISAPTPARAVVDRGHNARVWAGLNNNRLIGPADSHSRMSRPPCTNL